MGDGFAVLGERSVAEHTDGVQRQIRANPQDAGLRLALCHFLALRGQWQRAEDQLKAATKLDPSFAAASATCAMALVAERQRAAFWAGGSHAPTVLGGGTDWSRDLIAAAGLAADPAAAEAAARLRESARQAAPASRGTMAFATSATNFPNPPHTPAVRSEADGEDEAHEALQHLDFDWLCDGDMRIGPVFELFSPAGYAWLPMAMVRSVRLQRPRHLVDLLWAPAEFDLHDGHAMAGLIPVRYPVADLATLDDETTLGRRTDWQPLAGDDQYAGVGQRILISDAGDRALLELRSIEFAVPAEDALQ
jgi:type VI secretion system protein ImpE